MGMVIRLVFLYEVRLDVKKLAGQKGKVWRGMDCGLRCREKTRSPLHHCTSAIRNRTQYKPNITSEHRESMMEMLILTPLSKSRSQVLSNITALHLLPPKYIHLQGYLANSKCMCNPTTPRSKHIR